jgi:hypothetical protein
MTGHRFLGGSVRRLRARSDRRPSRRVGLAAALLHLGFGTVSVAFVTGVPVSLVDLIEGESHPTPSGAGGAPRHGHGQLLDSAVLLFVLACIGACAVALAERAVLLSAVAGGAAMIAIAYRRRRVRSATRVRNLSAEQPANPRGVGHE